MSNHLCFCFHIQVTSVIFSDDLSDGDWHTVYWVRGQTSINIIQGESSLSLATDFDPYHALVSPGISVYIGAKPYQTGKKPPMRHALVEMTIINSQYLEYSDLKVPLISTNMIWTYSIFLFKLQFLLPQTTDIL